MKFKGKGINPVDGHHSKIGPRSRGRRTLSKIRRGMKEDNAMKILNKLAKKEE